MTMDGRKAKMLASVLGMTEWYDDKAGVYVINKPYIADHRDAIDKLLEVGYAIQFQDEDGEVYPEEVAGDETYAVIYDPEDWD